MLDAQKIERDKSNPGHDGGAPDHDSRCRNTESQNVDATATRKAVHVPPLPNVLVVLPPNMPPEAVLLFEPKAVPVFEPKPEAKDELDRIPREAPGACRIGAHC